MVCVADARATPIAISTLGTYDLCFVPKGGKSAMVGRARGRGRSVGPFIVLPLLRKVTGEQGSGLDQVRGDTIDQSNRVAL